MAVHTAIEHARKLLEDRGHRPVDILRVEPDAILFTVHKKFMGMPPRLVARTAWLGRSNGRLLVTIEDGFPHEPRLRITEVTGA